MAAEFEWPRDKEAEQLSDTAIGKLYDVVSHLPDWELKALIVRLDGTPEDLLLDYANQQALARWPQLAQPIEDGEIESCPATTDGAHCDLPAGHDGWHHALGEFPTPMGMDNEIEWKGDK